MDKPSWLLVGSVTFLKIGEELHPDHQTRCADRLATMQSSTQGAIVE
jgi:hypothetical protein